jgi:hypothetical protein
MPQKKVSPSKSPGTERSEDESQSQEPQIEVDSAAEAVDPSAVSKTTNTDKKPNNKKRNLIFLLVSTMFFKLSFESVGTCFSNISTSFRWKLDNPDIIFLQFHIVFLLF